MPRRLTAALAACAVLVVGACSATSDDPDATSGTGGTSEESGAPPSGTSSPSDGPTAPTFKQPLSPDVTEAQLKTLLDDRKLPPGTTHGSVFETMTNAILLQPRHDVMLFGDSMTQQGIDPAQLGERLSTQVGRDVTVFNAASSRARWGVNRMVARYAEQHDKLPRVAVLVISTRAAESDNFYAADVQKTPFSHAVEGCDRPTDEQWDADARADCQADLKSLRHRYRTGGGQVQWALDGHPLQQEIDVDADTRLRPDGMLLHPSVTRAQATSISQEREKKGFPGFPRNDDGATAQYRDLVELLRSRGVTVISTEIPYTPVHQATLAQGGYDYEAEQGRGPRDYDTARQVAAARLAAGGGTRHFPVASFGDWWGDGSSRDAIHLAPEGAKDFADQLVDDTPGFADAVVQGLE